MGTIHAAFRERAEVKRYPNIDLLRLLLALDVVYVHSFLNPKPLPIFPTLSPVPAFLCVSGFLIPGSLLASRSYGHFAWKRILRLMPAFVAALGLVWAISGTHALVPTLVNYLTIGSFGIAFNSPLWSLMLEEVVYTFHAATRRLFTPTFAVLGLVLSLGLVFGLHGVAVGKNLVDWRLAPLPAFFAGNLLYFNRTKLQSVNLWVVGIAALAFTVHTGTVTGLGGLLVTIQSVAAVLIALSLPQWEIPKMPDFSYGIYIYHWPIMYALVRAGIAAWGLLGATLAFLVPLAALSWYLVEKPCLKWKNSPPTFSRRRAEIAEVVA